MQNNKKKYIAVLLFIIIIIILIIGLDNRLEVTNYNINNKKVKNKIKIAVIADLHNSEYKEKSKQVITKVIELKPNIILYAGDIADKSLTLENVKYVIEGLKGKAKSFYVTGNHEYMGAKINEIKKMLNVNNVEILGGKCIYTKANNNYINICGIDDSVSKNFDEQLKKVGNKIKKDNSYNILLSHRPEYIKEYVNYNFDLIISGHAHGGHWRIPFTKIGIYSPNQGIFPKYSGGKYKIKNKDFIVSRGLSKESTKIPKFYNRPEIVFINLK